MANTTIAQYQPALASPSSPTTSTNWKHIEAEIINSKSAKKPEHSAELVIPAHKPSLSASRQPQYVTEHRDSNVSTRNRTHQS